MVTFKRQHTKPNCNEQVRAARGSGHSRRGGGRGRQGESGHPHTARRGGAAARVSERRTGTEAAWIERSYI